MYLTRFIAGTGIGGEYAAINSAIDEMIPARYRGRTDIGVNGTYWLGSIIGTLVSLAFLNGVGLSLGWRLCFLVGPALAFVVIFVRRTLPESPRWLLMHGRVSEAEKTVADIEATVQHDTGKALAPVDESQAIEVKPTRFTGYLVLPRLLFTTYRRRAMLGASLMISQSFLYNAIFFTYGLVLSKFYHVSPAQTPLYLIAFAVGNLAGPLSIGRLFDTLGRRVMISATYIGSGIMLIITAALFNAGVLTATTQTIAWCVIFFFASAGASSGYLTVGEIFPLEVRAEAIAVFFAIAQCFGAVGPILYGALIGSGNDPFRLFIGYVIGGAIMVSGGVMEVLLGVSAEGKSLESVARPLSAVAPMGKACYSPGNQPSGTACEPVAR